MAAIPNTSITLLAGLSDGTNPARWADFYGRYNLPMRGFLASSFPTVDQDDVIQETLIALSKALPNYHYTADGNGHFRNYLMGIVKHKALDELRKKQSISRLKNGFAQEMSAPRHNGLPDDDDGWRLEAMEAALEQLLADDTITPRTREVFRHVALLHESPQDVARQFGISRGNVDQIKKRMIDKLSDMVAAMTGWRDADVRTRS